MCAGGLPVANKTNATDVVNAAMEIREFMIGIWKSEIDKSRNAFSKYRIGIHTGPVVAGIVGIKEIRLRHLGRYGEHCITNGNQRRSRKSKHQRKHL